MILLPLVMITQISEYSDSVAGELKWTDEVKEAANLVIGGNDDDGIAEYLYTLEALND